LPLPPYSPELNPMENVWDYLRQNKLASSLFGVGRNDPLLLGQTTVPTS
jgi:transposase